MEDITVIEQIRNGDTEAFSILVEKYHRQLLNFIFRLVGDESIVEDLGQEVFLNVYKSLKDFDTNKGTPFSAWLFISARNRCISELRSRKGREKVSLEEVGGLICGEGNAEISLLEKEKRHAVLSSLVQLPERYKNVILGSLRGDSLEEIAACEGISTGTVKSRLFRAREKMKLFVRAYYGGKGYERV